MTNQSINKLRINCLQLVKDHNSYEQANPENITDRLKAANVLELDVWGLGGIWAVTHSAPSKAKPLSAYLFALKNWHDKHPKHDLLWLNIDFKTAWIPGNGPEEFDAFIRKYFADDVLYRPNDLKGSKTDCRTAAAANEWPTFGSLKGRVIIVLTGGCFAGWHNQHLSSYVKKVIMGDGGYSATSFVAPDVDDSDDIRPGNNGDLDGINKEKMHVVMFNAKWANRAKINTDSIAKQNLILCFWDVPVDDANYSAAVQTYKASIIGTATRPEDIVPRSVIGERGRNMGRNIVTFYDEDNGWKGHGHTMNLGPGIYSYKGRNGWKDLPNGWNDEVRAVNVPAGVSVYMTDKDSFQRGGKGTVTITGPARVNINQKAGNSGLAGKVSSIKITA